MDLLKKVKEKTILFDGALGSMLMDSGHAAGRSPILFNLEQPDLVVDIHKQYYEAGSEVVATNTFGGNPLKLAAEGLEQQVESLNLEGVGLTRKVSSLEEALVVMGRPSGKMLQPLGEISPEEMQQNFFVQARVLIDAGVDLIAIETMFSLDEALAAVQGVRQAGDILVLASMTFNQNKNGFFTMMGENIARCTTALETAGVDMIGANCTLNSTAIIDLTTELRAATRLPILIQPNAGNPLVRKGVTYYEQSPAEFAADAKKIKDAGADMIGGCCGTTPEFIKEAAAVLDGS